MSANFRSKLSVEKSVPGFPGRLLPDLVIIDEVNGSAAIVDVCCPFENRYLALQVARQHKRDKYAPLADHLRSRGLTVTCDAIVVGALGCWDPENEKVLTHLGIPPHVRANLKRKAVSDVIRWSRDIYTEHVCNARQYKEDVVLPPIS
ncbi:Nucleoid-associated protein [Frankliniella fusca]|uniref:Nucleoid-associated protein n=1 Tax=Frankliniella fusca TaxID=407009 RepID=A0AAE1H729_9NEOP|nr:Nucleoid-associated protein [Frankliniella fusca]